MIYENTIRNPRCEGAELPVPSGLASIVFDTSWKSVGTRSIKSTPTATLGSWVIPDSWRGIAAADEHWYAEFVVAAPAAAASQSISIMLRFQNAAGATLSTTTITATLSPGGSMTMRADATAPAGAAFATLLSSRMSGAPGEAWNVDRIMLSRYAGGYFDGTTDSSDSITHTWMGPADASASRRVTYLDAAKLTIGRFGIDVIAGEASSADTSAAALSFSGETIYANYAESVVLRQQLLGYVDSPDESFVPVTWSDDPSLDGYYRVTSASVAAAAGSAPEGLLDFSVALERVQGSSAPLIECVSVGKKRASSLTLTARPVQAIPAGGRSYSEYHPDTRTTAARAVDTRRVGEKSVVNVFARGTTATDDYVVGQFYLPPAKFYEGAATLLLNGYVVAGRQILNTPDDWVLSNDVLQARPVAGSASLEVRMWTTAGWSAWIPFTLRSGTLEPGVGDALPAPHTLTVLSNSPEAVTIRLLTTVSYAPVTIDVTLRRGARSLAVQLNAGFYQFYSMNIPGFASPTALTGGFTKSISGVSVVAGSATNDGPAMVADNMRPGLDTATAPTYWSKSFSFCFGLTDGTAQTVLNEYFWAGTEKQTVVAR